MEHLDLHRVFPVQKPHQWPLPPSYVPYSPEAFFFSVCTNVSAQFLIYSAYFSIMTGYTKHSLAVWNWHYQVGINMPHNSSCTRGRQSKLTQVFRMWGASRFNVFPWPPAFYRQFPVYLSYSDYSSPSNSSEKRENSSLRTPTFAFFVLVVKEHL